MFCPNCGRNNSLERRFCGSCGTNLEAVSQALSGSKDDFFTKTDSALDQLIARYAEHVFKDAPSGVNDRKVSNSWKLLGQGILTTFVDVILFSLMWNILPLRFLILLISTPFRLLSQRGNKQEGKRIELENRRTSLPASQFDEGIGGAVPSVSEHTTESLERYSQPRQAGEGQ